MASKTDKSALIAALRDRIEAQLDALTSSQKTVQAGAVHEETRQENPKDTRAIEAQYLARGLAERVESVKDDSAALAALRPRAFGERDPVALTALVRLELDAVGGGGFDIETDDVLYFVVPCAGGERLTSAGREIFCVTPHSPIGRELVGRRVDDDVELELPAGRRKGVVVSVE